MLNLRGLFAGFLIPFLAVAAHAVPVITSPSSATGTQGVLFTYQITATENPTTFGIAQGVPAGFTLSPGGLLYGVPTVSGSAVLTVGAQGPTGTGTLDVTFTINPSGPAAPIVNSPASASGTVGTPFNYQITATNSPTSFVILNPSPLPAGYTLSPSGLLSGTPTAPGSAVITVGAANAGGTGTQDVAVTFNSAPAPVITSPLNVSTVVGAWFSYQITASNNPTSFALINPPPSSLPPGWSFNAATGELQGIPPSSLAGGTYPVTFSASNGTATQFTVNLTINNSQPPIFTSAPNAVGTVGVTFGHLVSAINYPIIISPTKAVARVGVPFNYQTVAQNNPTQYRIISGPPLVSGWGMNAATGLFSGTPPAGSEGVYNFILGARNGVGETTRQLELTIISAATPNITSPSTATGEVGQPFTYTISGSNNPTTFGINGSATPALPSGWTFNSNTGTLSGTPDASLIGIFPITVGARSTAGDATMQVYLSFAPPASPITFGATGLPAGLSITPATGIISGTPSAVGNSNATITATDAFGTANQTLAISINTQGLTITSPSSASGVVGYPFTLYRITATGNPNVFGATGLPPGLTVNTSNGDITGTPTRAGSYVVNLSAINQANSTAGTKVLTITIDPAPLNPPNITSAGTATGVVGTPFRYQITATQLPTSFGAASLPQGLTINSATGLITGVPSIVGIRNVTISATNGVGSGSRTLTVTISPQNAQAPGELANAHAYPIPYKPSKHGNGITFSNLGTNSSVVIKIFTIKGELVKEIRNTSGLSTVQWNPVTNDSGETVASGVYVFRVKSNTEEKTGKLIIAR